VDILIGKFVKPVFTADKFGIYSFRVHGGKYITALIYGEQPKMLKTVEFKLTGKFEHNKQYGKQLRVHSFERYKKPDRKLSGEIAILAKANKALGVECSQ